MGRPSASRFPWGRSLGKCTIHYQCVTRFLDFSAAATRLGELLEPLGGVV